MLKKIFYLLRRVYVKETKRKRFKKFSGKKIKFVQPWENTQL